MSELVDQYRVVFGVEGFGRIEREIVHDLGGQELEVRRVPDENTCVAYFNLEVIVPSGARTRLTRRAEVFFVAVVELTFVAQVVRFLHVKVSHVRVGRRWRGVDWHRVRASLSDSHRALVPFCAF